MTKKELEKERARVRLENDWGWDEHGNPLPKLSDNEADAKIFGDIPKDLRVLVDPETGIDELIVNDYKQKKQIEGLNRRITKLEAENAQLKSELARCS